MQPPQGPYDPNAYPPAVPQWTQMPPPYQGGNGAGQTPPPGQLPPPAQIAPPYQQPAGYAPEGAQEIGAAFAQLSGYALEDTPFASGFAGYKDWFIDALDRPGYTVEAGRGENPLPITDFDAIYERNLGILTLGALVT